MERSPKKRSPDISLTAGAKARELRFERVPDTETRFWGQDERETESGTERENLPDEVERDVVYRNVRIRLKTTARITGAEQSPEDKQRRGPAKPLRTTRTKVDKPTKRSER